MKLETAGRQAISDGQQHRARLALLPAMDNNIVRVALELNRRQYYADRVFSATAVAMYPTITYSFYPAFVEYPGSTTLRLETARDMVIDIVRSIARHGPRRFYILNTGVSTVRALQPAQDSLAAGGILMRFTNGGERTRAAEERLRQQPGGTHADEFETSMLLYMYPERVDMSKAAKDYHPGQSPLVRDSARAAREGRTWSRTGIYGDATLATREKGRIVVEAHLEDILEEIAALRRMPLPPGSTPRSRMDELTGSFSALAGR